METKFPGVFVVKPEFFYDKRGYFTQVYHYEQFHRKGLSATFVQDNQSLSMYGTLRGLHYQKEPWAQTKLIRVLQGKVYDVIVDIRVKSSTFGQWFGLELSSENPCMVYISRGFAHGFLTLSSQAIFEYKCDNYYQPSESYGILHNDPFLGILWPIPLDGRYVSDQDQNWPLFKDIRFESPDMV